MAVAAEDDVAVGGFIVGVDDFGRRLVGWREADAHRVGVRTFRFAMSGAWCISRGASTTLREVF